MKIGIIGAGAIGKVYARLWHEAGHKVFLSSRTPTDHQGFVNDLGPDAFAGSVADAAAFGDVILFAPNYESAESAIVAMTPHVAGKLVIDATNPLRFNETGELESMIADGDIAARVMATKLPEARLAKTFTTLWSGHIETIHHLSPSPPVECEEEDVLQKRLFVPTYALPTCQFHGPPPHAGRERSGGANSPRPANFCPGGS